MKLIIDIQDHLYSVIKNKECTHNNILTEAVLNGTPIPDNATNGQVIMALFPNEHDFETDFDADWWNAPYQKGGKE